MGEQAVQSSVSIIWTSWGSRDSTLSTGSLAGGKRLEVIGVSTASTEHELVATSRGSIVVESDGWSGAGSDGKWKGADGGALLTSDPDWVTADSGGGVGHRVWLDAALLDSRTVRVHPTSDGGILEDGNAEWTRARSRL